MRTPPAPTVPVGNAPTPRPNDDLLDTILQFVSGANTATLVRMALVLQQQIPDNARLLERAVFHDPVLELSSVRQWTEALRKAVDDGQAHLIQRITLVVDTHSQTAAAALMDTVQRIRRDLTGLRAITIRGPSRNCVQTYTKTWRALLSVLIAVPELHQLHLLRLNRFGDLDQPAFQSMVAHCGPRLRELVLDWGNTHGGLRYTDIVRDMLCEHCTGLVTFGLTIHNHDDETGLGAVIDSLVNDDEYITPVCGDSLTSLSVCSDGMYHEAWRKFLARLPALRQLSVRLYRPSDRWLEANVVVPDDARVLERVDLTIDGDYVAGFVRNVRTPTNVCALLRPADRLHVRIELSHYPTTPDLAIVDDLGRLLGALGALARDEAVLTVAFRREPESNGVWYDPAARRLWAYLRTIPLPAELRLLSVVLDARSVRMPRQHAPVNGFTADSVDDDDGGVRRKFAFEPPRRS